jgi:tRNA1(Val) A37 N6-methylase TrmN6
MMLIFICLFILMDYYIAMPQKQDIFTALGGKVRFFRGSYNPASDAVWLAAFAGPAENVLDVGVGTGGAALCYAYHNPDAKMTGLDVSDQRLGECARNAELNGRRIELLNQDILTWKTGRSFDLVITNPPFFKGTPAGHGAHHNANLGEWTRGCLKRVRAGGRFCAIVDGAAMSDIVAALGGACGDIIIFPLFGAAIAAERVLIGARLGGRGGTRLFSGLSMNHEPVLRDGLTIWSALATI